MFHFRPPEERGKVPQLVPRRHFSLFIPVHRPFSSCLFPLFVQLPTMTTPNLAAPPVGYTTIPSPSTPSTALPQTARLMTAGTQQSVPATTATLARVYQPERTRRGRMFPDDMVRERMQQMCQYARKSQPSEYPCLVDGARFDPLRA